MDKYVERLIACGYSVAEAYAECYTFIKNFSIVELESYVSWIENVDKI